jgi:hypothetical protein
MMSFSILRMMAGPLDGALSQITRALNIAESQALSPLKAIVQSVVGGVWVGRGADALVEVVSQMAIPGVGQVMSQVSKFSGDIQHARELVNRADQEISRQVRSRLTDTFKFF